MKDITHKMPEVGFMRLPEILKVFPVGKSTWFANVRLGIYPKPVKLGPNTSAWRVEDIRALITRYESSTIEFSQNK